MTDVKYYRYVLFARIPAYIALGWTVEDTPLHSPHGWYAVLMEYGREGQPVDPEALA